MSEFHTIFAKFTKDVAYNLDECKFSVEFKSWMRVNFVIRPKPTSDVCTERFVSEYIFNHMKDNYKDMGVNTMDHINENFIADRKKIKRKY